MPLSPLNGLCIYLSGIIDELGHSGCRSERVYQKDERERPTRQSIRWSTRKSPGPPANGLQASLSFVPLYSTVARTMNLPRHAYRSWEVNIRLSIEQRPSWRNLVRRLQPHWRALACSCGFLLSLLLSRLSRDLSFSAYFLQLDATVFSSHTASFVSGIARILNFFSLIDWNFRRLIISKIFQNIMTRCNAPYNMIIRWA